MKVYRVTGKFWMGHIQTPFTLETIGVDEAAARDRVLSSIGSKHRVDRHHIDIANVQEIRPDEITDPLVEKRLSMAK